MRDTSNSNMKNLVVFEVYIDAPTWEVYRRIPIEFEQEPYILLKKRFAKILSIKIDESLRGRDGTVASYSISVAGGLPKDPEWLYKSCTLAVDMVYRAINLHFDKLP